MNITDLSTCAAAQARWLEQASRLFADAAALAHDGVGISRESYGAGESATLDLLRDWAAGNGLHSATDFAGNGLFSAAAQVTGSSVVCGSHIDSVPQGGNFDGLAGVVAGLLVLDRLRREGQAARFQVVATRGEESAWYGKAYIGSSAALGLLKPDDLALANKHGGRILREAMAEAGADLAAIKQGTVAPWAAQASAYLELHIEQGPLMVEQGWPTAIVSGIRGNLRHNRVLCHGQAGHSGAIPRWLRKDAVFAVADLLMRLDRHWRRLLDEGADLVLTSGLIATDSARHAVSRIPELVEFSFEVRSQDEATLAAFYALMREECDAVAQERGVRFEFDRKILSRPAIMAPALVQTLLRASARAGQPGAIMPSGAGHDAALFANAGIPAAMIFIRNEHGSHNPREAMALADFVSGVEVLYQAVKELA